LDATPKAVHGEVKANVQAILRAPDMDTARMLLTKTLEAFAKKAPRAMEILEIDNKWAGGRRYLDMTEYHEYRSCRPKSGSNIFYL